MGALILLIIAIGIVWIFLKNWQRNATYIVCCMIFVSILYYVGIKAEWWDRTTSFWIVFIYYFIVDCFFSAFGSSWGLMTQVKEAFADDAE